MTVDSAPGEPTLTEEQFERLATYGEPASVQVGDVLYATGDVAYDLFLVRTAEVDVIRDGTAADPEHLVYRRGPGGFLGELNLLTGQKVYLTTRVSKAGDIVRIDWRDFRRVLSEQVDIADVLVEALRVRRRLLQTLAASALEIVEPSGSPEGRALRTFAARLELPHTALSPDSVQGQALMAVHGLVVDDLPAAVISDTVLRRASPVDVARAIGLTYRPPDHDVDLVVVGAGPAGLAAAVYAASEGLVTVLFDALGAGGQAATTSRIENYLGFPRGLSGEELTRLALVQAMKFGAQLYAPAPVVALEPLPGAARVRLGDGSALSSRAVIVATGARYRRLDVARWTELEVRGDIRYSATELDVRDCESRPVTVVGGANAAGQAALFLASRGSRVDLLVRGLDVSSMSDYLAQRLLNHSLVRVWNGVEVCRLGGDPGLSVVTVRDREGRERDLDSVALFCFIGADPDTDWLGWLERDEGGFILTDHGLSPTRGHAALPFQTSSPHVFAAGDVRSGSMKRVASAVGEGASAVASVHRALAASTRESPSIGRSLTSTTLPT